MNAHLFPLSNGQHTLREFSPAAYPPLPNKHEPNQLSPPNFQIPLLSPAEKILYNSSPANSQVSSTARSLNCPQCKGLKYVFTPYFHNTAIFYTPPHSILSLIEHSYVLKNRLQSLLITYISQSSQVSQRNACEGEIDIKLWELQVDALIGDVEKQVGNGEGGDCIGIAGGGGSEVKSAVEIVNVWVKGTVRRMWEHVNGVKKMDLPKGRVKELVSEFRKGWEGVWVIVVNGSSGANLAEKEETMPTTSSDIERIDERLW